MQYEIQKDVLIPKRQSNFIKWPLRDLAVGDSFYIENQLDKHRVICAAWRISKKWGMKFTVRDMESLPGFRVWRTK